MSKLTVADIADLRAYESIREEFRRKVIETKNLRRVAVGPIVSLTFENEQTIRFQVQEMARAERILGRDRIQEELDTYNPLIPEPGHLSATLFLELTTEPDLRYWLPKLVGIETSIELRIGTPLETVRCVSESGHQSQLTREDITPAVHYIAFSLLPEQVDRFATGPVFLAIAHPAYQEETELSGETRASLAEDLYRGG